MLVGMPIEMPVEMPIKILTRMLIRMLNKMMNKILDEILNKILNEMSGEMLNEMLIKIKLLNRFVLIFDAWVRSRDSKFFWTNQKQAWHFSDFGARNYNLVNSVELRNMR